MMKKTGKLFIVSGPSGAGKSTLCKNAVEHFGDLIFSISCTTRRPRPGERDGKDYRFVGEQRFRNMIKRGEFLEYATVHGNLYGTGRKDVEKAFSKGSDVLLDIDVQGADNIRKKTDRGVYIFVLPPSMDASVERLSKRGDIPSAEMEKRLEAARKEVRKMKSYDYIIINKDLEGAFERLKAIITAERSKKEAMMGEVRRLFKI